MRGTFVRDQVEALRGLSGLELELFTFDSLGASAYASAARALRRRYAGSQFDVVHAHFGLNAWPSLVLRGPAHGVTLHGTDLVHPRSRAVTVPSLPFMDLVAPVSHHLESLVPRRLVRGQLAVLPCGVDVRRFHPLDRREARRMLGLDESGPYLLFPADPTRAEKRYDRALEAAGDVPLLALGGVEPSDVPVWINAVNAVLVTSERESFGLAVLEALACDVPVLATPVGVAPEVLAGVSGTYCGAFDLDAWRRALAPVVADEDPRVAGRTAAGAYSAERMAERMLEAWRAVVG